MGGQGPGARQRVKKNNSVALAASDYVFGENDHVIVAGAFKNVDRLKH